MILAKAPLRMSFVGGGSDVRSYYSHDIGKVISTTINKYVYVALKNKFGSGFRISYSKTENCNSIEDIEHPIIRECLKYFNLKEGLEIVTMADIPGSGSGLGSSSSFTVALLRALFAYKRIDVENSEIAKIACEIEIEKCREPIGKQDQYAAALGGFNEFCFHHNEEVTNNRINLDHNFLKTLEAHTLVLFTNTTRSASTILKDQNKNLSTDIDKRLVVKQMVELVDPFVDSLYRNEIKQLGKLLDKNWQLKTKLSKNVTNQWINDSYCKAMSLGAFGGKIMGAGAGGFFLFFADPKLHEIISLKLGMQRTVVKFENYGCQIIYKE